MCYIFADNLLDLMEEIAGLNDLLNRTSSISVNETIKIHLRVIKLYYQIDFKSQSDSVFIIKKRSVQKNYIQKLKRILKQEKILDQSKIRKILIQI